MKLGMSAGIDDHRALLLQDGDGVGDHLRLLGVEAAARVAFARQRHAVDVERARHADARALQAAGVQEFRVVAPGRRRAGAGRRVIRIRRRRPSMAPSMIAASATVRVIGPAVSCSAVMGITP